MTTAIQTRNRTNEMPDIPGKREKKGLLAIASNPGILTMWAAPVNMPKGARIRGVMRRLRKTITRTKRIRPIVFPVDVAMLYLLDHAPRLGGHAARFIRYFVIFRLRMHAHLRDSMLAVVPSGAGPGSVGAKASAWPRSGGAARQRWRPGKIRSCPGRPADPRP